MYERIIKVALLQIQCQLHDHAKQYDNDETCHKKWNGGKLHGNISRNGYGNAMVGRYGVLSWQNWFKECLEAQVVSLLGEKNLASDVYYTTFFL